MATHHTPSSAILDLRLPAGLIEVTTTDTDSTTVSLEPLGGGDAAREAIASTREEAVGEGDGTVRVIVHVPERGRLLRLRGEPELLLRVTAPHGARLRATTLAADVRADGRLGAAELKTASGDVALPDVAGPVDVRTQSGDVRVGAVTGDVRVHTMSGDLIVGDVDGSVATKTMSGDVTLGAVARSLEASSMSGDLEVAGVRSGAADLSSMSGDVDVGVARGTRVYMDVKTLAGDARSDLPVSDEPIGAGSAELTLRVSTKSGDVRVRRAPERASGRA
jgi:Putative adhesin